MKPRDLKKLYVQRGATSGHKCELREGLIWRVLIYQCGLESVGHKVLSPFSLGRGQLFDVT